MNLNPLATAALVVLASSQVAQAYVKLQTFAEEVHFLVVQQFCKKEVQKSGDGKRVYVGCMAELTQGKRL